MCGISKCYKILPNISQTAAGFQQKLSLMQERGIVHLVLLRNVADLSPTCQQLMEIMVQHSAITVAQYIVEIY